MPITGEVEPSKWDWVQKQADEYEASGGTRYNTLRDTGQPIIVMTTLGRKTGKVRKVPLMRVEHDGEYAIVASKGGAPEHPGWYYNLLDHPTVMIQDGPEPHDYAVRLITGEERAAWWERCVAAFSNYAEYQQKTDREIPVFIASRV